MIELPYLAAFAVTRACLPAMLARGSGQILNVTSTASNMVWPNAAAYIAARRTLKGFSDALRLEVALRGLFVSLVVLGPVESSYWEHNPGSRGRVPKGFAPLSTVPAVVRDGGDCAPRHGAGMSDAEPSLTSSSALSTPAPRACAGPARDGRRLRRAKSPSAGQRARTAFRRTG